MTYIPEKTWYNDKSGFFGRGYLREYESYLTEDRTRAEVDFLERVLQIRKGGRIFDCPCGHGRHLIELARRGYEGTGQDINTSFLQMAKENARELKQSIRFINGDMREIRFKEEFSFAICLFSSFGYLETDDDHQLVLKQVSNALKHGGKFVLDVINRERFLRTYQRHTWKKLSDGSVIISENNFNQITGRNLEKRVRIWVNGEREEVLHPVRMYTVPELVNMLGNAEMITRETFGDFDANPITLKSKRYILIAEKI